MPTYVRLNEAMMHGTRARPTGGLIAARLLVMLVAMAVAMAVPMTGRGSAWARQEGAATASPEPGCAPPTATPTAGERETTEDLASEEELAMIEAATRGDPQTVTRLLAAGARVDARDGRGQTALIAAAWRNDLAIACMLISAGADVNAKDETEQSAYLIATSEGYLELLRATLAAGADVRSLDSFRGTGLIRAAERGHVEIVAELLTTEIAVDHVNRLGLTALLEAIMFGDGGGRHTAVVQRLIAAGADPNLADGAGVTPLTHARERGFGLIIDILEAAGGR